MWLSNVGTIPRLEVWKKGSWQQAGEQVKQGLKRRLTCSSFFLQVTKQIGAMRQSLKPLHQSRPMARCRRSCAHGGLGSHKPIRNDKLTQQKQAESRVCFLPGSKPQKTATGAN